MTEQRCEVDDEVWVRSKVVSSAGIRNYGGTLGEHVEVGNATRVVVLTKDIRRPDDFKNLLDDAIIKAAIDWHTLMTDDNLYAADKLQRITKLDSAVQAKLESVKPKDPRTQLRDVIHKAFSELDVGPCSGRCETFADAIMAAGLLKEEPEK